MKILDGLGFGCIGDGNLQVGSIKACLDFLGIDVSASWLVGGTGHAFLMSVGEGAGICDTYFALASDEDRAGQIRLGRNVGYELDMQLAWPDDQELDEKRAKALVVLHKAIDAGLPCFGWCHFMYHTFCAYDDSGQFYTGPYEVGGEPRGPVPWEAMGGLEIYVLEPGQPADDRTTVKEGIEFALDYARRNTGEGDAHGLQGFDNWIAAMEAQQIGAMFRHAPAWFVMRDLAVEFLAEARERLSGEAGDLFDGARQHYQVVADNLRPLAERFTEENTAQNEKDIQDDAIRAEIVAHLRAARAAEAEGLAALERIVEALR